jgi:hypothetical protein
MLRLLDPNKGYEQLHIETFCDFYGPQYKIIIDLDQHGNTTTSTPDTALILLGSKVVKSCANNRIAYNQTAANALLSQGYTEHTMHYQQNPLPEGTPTLPVANAAPMLAKMGITYVPPSPLVPALLLVAGMMILVGSFITYKKLKPA